MNQWISHLLRPVCQLSNTCDQKKLKWCMTIILWPHSKSICIGPKEQIWKGKRSEDLPLSGTKGRWPRLSTLNSFLSQVINICFTYHLSGNHENHIQRYRKTSLWRHMKKHCTDKKNCYYNKILASITTQILLKNLKPMDNTLFLY